MEEGEVLVEGGVFGTGFALRVGRIVTGHVWEISGGSGI